MRFLATLLLLTGMTLCAQDAPPAPKKGGGGPPKNLKILKPEEVRPMMASFNAALGTASAGGCNFCHVQDRSSDENPKKVTARMMIEMVNHINSQFPDGKVHVTCYTCHRGKAAPETVAPPAQ